MTRTMAAVKDRLTKEITYWDHRANQLKDQELAGKVNAKINSGKARQRADELQARLQRRMAELELERQISPLPPVAIGGSLVVPVGSSQEAQPRHPIRTVSRQRSCVGGSPKEDGTACHADGHGSREVCLAMSRGRERREVWVRH